MAYRLGAHPIPILVLLSNHNLGGPFSRRVCARVGEKDVEDIPFRFCLGPLGIELIDVASEQPTDKELGVTLHLSQPSLAQTSRENGPPRL